MYSEMHIWCYNIKNYYIKQNKRYDSLKKYSLILILVILKCYVGQILPDHRALGSMLD